MRKFYIALGLILSPLVLGGCPDTDPAKKIKEARHTKPELNLDEISVDPEFLKKYICLKRENEEVSVSEEASNQARRLLPRIEVYDHKNLNCEKQVIEEVKDVEEIYSQILLITSPDEVSGIAQFAQVENIGRCRTLSLQSENISSQVNSSFGNETAEIPFWEARSQMSETAAISLVVTNHPYIGNDLLALAEGLNALEIRYYSDCEMTSVEGKEIVQCDDDFLLGKKELVIDFNPELVKIDEPKQIDRCEKDEK